MIPSIHSEMAFYICKCLVSNGFGISMTLIDLLRPCILCEGSNFTKHQFVLYFIYQ